MSHDSSTFLTTVDSLMTADFMIPTIKNTYYTNYLNYK